MTFQEILSRLENVKKNGNGYTAKCPSHDDKKNSLSITEAQNKVVLYCHAGCSANDVCAGAEIKLKDLFFDSNTAFSNDNGSNGHSKTKVVIAERKGIKEKLVCAYRYTDENGKLLYENVRFEPKDFRQRHFDENGKEVWNLGNVRRVPYRLPELIEASSKNPDQTIYLCEGEKDVDNLRKIGLVSTSFKNWKREFNEFITGTNVVLLVDHDEPGLKQAESAARVIKPVVKSFKIVDLFQNDPLPEKHGPDVSDWLDQGNDKDDLLKIVEKQEGSPTQIVLPKIGLTFGELMDLDMPKREEIISGLAPGENGLINAVTNVGKTTLIRNASVSLICGKPFPPITKSGRKMRVVIIDSEDSLVFLRSDISKMISKFSDEEKKLVKENLLLICDVSFADEELRINKKEHFDSLVAAICEFKADIIFIDTISASFVIHNENDNSEVKERVMKPLKRLAKLTNTAVLASHHIGKAKMEEGASRENSHRGRGASAFADQSRVIFNLERDAADNVILSCPKLKGEKFADTIFKYDKETRWFENQGESVSKIKTNTEHLMDLFTDSATALKRCEIDKRLEDIVAKSTISRLLKEAVTKGELVTSNAIYAKNAQMLMLYSDEHLSISDNSPDNNSLQGNEQMLENDREHFFEASEVEYF